MNFATTLGTLFSVAMASALVGASIWWFIRRRRREMHMPMMRILDLPQTKLPKVVIRKPPLIPFLAFCVAALAFLLWSAEPRNREFATHEPRQLRVHVFVDMSPSISAHVTLFDFARQVSSLWGDLRNVSRVTLSTSHADTIYDVQESGKVEEIIQGLAFHRAGTQIGASIKKHLLQTGEIDRLIIVSDRDLSSWLGFQWKYLADDTEVYWFNTDRMSERDAKPNAFINGVRISSVPGATMLDWDVDVSQGGVAKLQEGTLRAKKGSETLANASWKLSEGSRGVTVRISWPNPFAKQSTQGASVPTVDQGEPILWEITSQGDDAIAMDNEFRSTESGRGGVARIIAEPAGEQPLDDPGSILQTALGAMGVMTERVDFVDDTVRRGEDATSEPRPLDSVDLVVAFGGLGRGVSSFCPRSSVRRLWLVPWSDTVDHQELCECAAQIQKISSDMCSQVHARAEWVAWLNQMGGQQIGGTLGQTGDAVAFGFVKSSPQQTSLSSLLALTIPLRPTKTFGLSYGRFPVLVRQLFLIKTTAGGLIQDTDALEPLSDWPRIANVSEAVLSKDGRFFSAKNSQSLTNVPLGESLLAIESLSELPKQWESGEMGRVGRGPGKLDSEDPLPWIRIAVFVLLAASLFELLWLLKNRKRVESAVVSIALLTLTASISSSGFAQVCLDFYRIPNASQMGFSRLAREVSSRTSIEMAPRAEVFDGAKDRLFEQPWIWIRSVDGVSTKTGEMQPAMVRWLKRGGFLFVESNGSDNAVWDKFTSPLTDGSFRPQGWNAVPQDHEFMRSFYLLATLPSCNGQLWRWYGIDGRMAILQAPYSFSSFLSDQPTKGNCDSVNQSETQYRVFVNLLMVALTTDYKRDQIHLPEILKRLRAP